MCGCSHVFVYEEQTDIWYCVLCGFAGEGIYELLDIEEKIDKERHKTKKKDVLKKLEGI